MELTNSPESIKLILAILGGLIAIITTGLGIQWRYYKQKKEVIDDKYQSELLRQKAEYENKIADVKKSANQELDNLKNRFESELKEAVSLKPKEKSDSRLIQNEKVIYVKYLYIKSERGKPVYRKYIERTGKYIDVHSEYHMYRFNRYSSSNNETAITDSTSGVVDLNIVHPWRQLIFTDENRKKKEDFISQNLSGSDTYFSVSTYYNGFNAGEGDKENEDGKGNEDIGMKMEMDTENARLIADFSSIIGFEKLFKRSPDVIHKKADGSADVKIHGLEEIRKGIYHIHKTNLKKGDVIRIDFHVDWDFWEKKKK